VVGRDALVLKELALVLARVLPASPRCTHFRGHGGGNAAAPRSRRRVPETASRCASTSSRIAPRSTSAVDGSAGRPDPRARLSQPARSVPERTAESGVWFRDHEHGISRGFPLSPMIGAFFLEELDYRMSETGLFYNRFMDDIPVLAPTR
jgi:hypothetical protein